MPGSSMPDAMGFTTVLKPEGWVVVDRYATPIGQDTYSEYGPARAEAERLNEKAADVNRKRN